MSSIADQTISALRGGHDALVAFVGKLSQEDLLRPSGASDWQVSQVLSHLGSGAEINLAALRAATSGGATPDGDFNRSVWARWDAMSPAEQAAGFVESNARLVEAYEALDPTARAQLRIDLGFLPEPVDVATSARMRLSEFALHRWDVEVGFDPAASVSAEAVPLLLDNVAGMLAWTSRTDVLAGRQVVLTVRLDDPSRVFGLRLGERVELVEAPEQSDGELVAPAEAWLRLTVGRLGPQHTPEGVRLTGPLSLDELRSVFPGF
ncbi:maleylpyruvate isomerase family mycothiol-dependent enzyme [Micromonospora sp. 15K316]|uniref:maleylpyruvate isomerase N-terminal domain-containing protein n=1 Tax=Micromonospora sp. 15K316 TaxID=2530376 RepID=UPI001049F880|nr:maleylpyruvate isomerase N-terminal domain-containing protein [Micromonospora sp. 15K316]TDC38230.1 maleylpyruvate isomerase family mycothiol-dependent enzyme [Micromonospora sp. 15K316]